MQIEIPTEIHWYRYTPWLCNSNKRGREDSLSTSGMPKSSNCRANWYSVCRTNRNISFIFCCFSMNRNWLYQKFLHFLWLRTTFTMWNLQVFVSKAFIRHHQTAVEKNVWKNSWTLSSQFLPHLPVLQLQLKGSPPATWAGLWSVRERIVDSTLKFGITHRKYLN